jgi:quercetin dioxygenase-like cupin family protein
VSTFHRLWPLATVVTTLALAAGCAPGQAIPATPAAPDGARPLVLQAAEGERRMHRSPPGALSNLAAPFIFKVDRRNGGAPEFVMFTEDIPSGQAIPPHQHPDADEILFVYGGTGLAVLGGHEAVVQTGSTIYMPRNTAVRLRNTGKEPLRIAAFFSKPGYDDYMRDISVAEGAVAPPLTVEELTAIRARHRAHVVYQAP